MKNVKWDSKNVVPQSDAILAVMSESWGRKKRWTNWVTLIICSLQNLHL
jgi:hypothetical protein